MKKENLKSLVTEVTQSNCASRGFKKTFQDFWLKAKVFLFPLVFFNIILLDLFLGRPFFLTAIKLTLFSLSHYIFLYLWPYVFETKYYLLWRDIKKHESQNTWILPVKNSVQILLLIWTFFVYCFCDFLGDDFKSIFILTGLFTGLSYLLCLFIIFINLYKMPKVPKKLYILHGVHVRWMPIFGLLNKGVPLCRNIISLAGASGMTAELGWKAAHGGIWVSPWRGECANYIYDRPFGYRWTEVELMRAAIDSIEKHNASLYAKLNMTDPNPPLTLEDLTKQAADIQSKIDKFKDK